MDKQAKQRQASEIAREVAGQWQARSRIIVLATVIAAGYLIDYLFFRYENAGEFVIIIAFLVHIGLQIWVPGKVFEIVYNDTFKASLKNL